jgi:hypothetical protein
MLGRRRGRSAVSDDSGKQRDLSPEGLRQAAAESAAAGDLRGALRLRFLAVISEAHVPFSTLMTNSQIIRSVKASHPGLVKPLGELVLAFENAWYGGQQVDAESYRQADRLAESMEAGLGGDD